MQWYPWHFSEMSNLSAWKDLWFWHNQFSAEKLGLGHNCFEKCLLYAGLPFSAMLVTYLSPGSDLYVGCNNKWNNLYNFLLFRKCAVSIFILFYFSCFFCGAQGNIWSLAKLQSSLWSCMAQVHSLVVKYLKIRTEKENEGISTQYFDFTLLGVFWKV